MLNSPFFGKGPQRGFMVTMRGFANDTLRSTQLEVGDLPRTPPLHVTALEHPTLDGAERALALYAQHVDECVAAGDRGLGLHRAFEARRGRRALGRHVDH